MADKKITQFSGPLSVPNQVRGMLLPAGKSDTGKLHYYAFDQLESWIKALIGDSNDTTLLSIEIYEDIGLSGSVITAGGNNMDGALRNYNSLLRIATGTGGITVEPGKTLAIARVKPNLTPPPSGKQWMAVPVVAFSRISDSGFYPCQVVGRPFLTADTAPDWEIVLINPTGSSINLGAEGEETFDLAYTCRYIPVTLS